MSEEKVKRLRFTDKGEVLEESTYVTEAELQGFQEEQMPLGIGAGERPIEEADYNEIRPTGLAKGEAQSSYSPTATIPSRSTPSSST